MSSLITSVDSGSPAARAGVSAGLTLLAINGHSIRDVLDYRYWSEDARLTLELADAGGAKRTLHLKKAEGIPLGLNFETYLMDGQRSCANNCVFCFIDQLPRGMRDTLYYKDDDARLSFLQGNYVTLTNLSQREIDRICDLRISPLNISVHASDPDVRRAMLRNPRAGECMDIMKRFAASGIEMNCQIVLCPGFNDGDRLDETLNALTALWPGVHSVSVVPVGVTRWRDRLYPIRPVSPEDASDAIARVERISQRCLKEYSCRVVYCSDELYLRAEAELPSIEAYEDLPQYENGVGMLRSLESEFAAALRQAGNSVMADVSIATGTAAFGFFKNLSHLVSKMCYNINIEVYAVENDFFGHTVDVAGLLTGGDLKRQLAGKRLGDRLLISSTMLRHGGDVFLDDVSLSELSEALGVPVIPVQADGFELLDAIFGVN